MGTGRFASGSDLSGAATRFGKSIDRPDSARSYGGMPTSADGSDPDDSRMSFSSRAFARARKRETGRAFCWMLGRGWCSHPRRRSLTIRFPGPPRRQRPRDPKELRIFPSTPLGSFRARSCGRLSVGPGPHRARGSGRGADAKPPVSHWVRSVKRRGARARAASRSRRAGRSATIPGRRRRGGGGRTSWRGRCGAGCSTRGSRSRRGPRGTSERCGRGADARNRARGGRTY